MSEFVPVSSGTCRKQSVSGLSFASRLADYTRLAEPDQQKKGYLLSEDEEKSVDEMSKFGIE